MNGVGLVLLHAGREDSLNVRGAWLHVMADAAGSVGAIVAGVLVWWRGWNLADPIASVLIGTLVLGSSWRLLRDSVAVLMQGTPDHIDLDEVTRAITSVEGATEVHDLHVWTVTSGIESLSAHVVVDDRRPGSDVLSDVREAIHDGFGIEHCTIQLEPEGFDERESPV